MAAITASLALVACGGGQEPGPVPGPAPEPSNAQKLAELERAGVLPTLDRSDSLAGPDADRNRVRDDIDAYIQRTYPNAAQRAAALQLARGFQASVVLDSTDREAHRLVGRQISRGIHCVVARFPADGDPSFFKIQRELQSMTANTKARLKAYLQHNKALDGTSWALPKEDTCE